VLFGAAAAYDIVLAVVFGLFFAAIYQRFGATLPNHAGYVQLPALFILTFGIGFWMVARDPVRNRPIMPLGILMKLSFCVVAFGHVLFGAPIPLFIPFAVIDALFAVAFVVAYRSISGGPL
jgi:hypothetical protein